MVLSCPSSNFFPRGIILCSTYLLIRGSVCGPRLLGSFSREFMVGPPATVGSPPARYPWSSIYLHWLLPAALSTAEKLITPFLSIVINCEADNMYATKIKPFSPTFQQLTNPSLMVLISLSPSREMYHLSRDIKGECPAFPLIIAYFPVETMPGHDHSLKGLFEPESLNSETMLLTWICPVKQGETSPAEVLGRIFTKYQELL